MQQLLSMECRFPLFHFRLASALPRKHRPSPLSSRSSNYPLVEAPPSPLSSSSGNYPLAEAPHPPLSSSSGNYARVEAPHSPLSSSSGNYPRVEAPHSPLSSRPKRSEVERSLCGCSFLEMCLNGGYFKQATLAETALHENALRETAVG